MPAKACIFETLYIRGGTSQNLNLREGDRVKIRDEEGAQPCEFAGEMVLGDAHPPGTEITRVIKTAGLHSIAALGEAMSPDRQNPPTDLLVQIHRANGQCLPPPLARPLLELRVAAASAEAYEVKAGQYIQIIDLDGQQCSDFLAFDARALAEGAVRGLDATTTRTLNASLYPAPGLAAKFFDERMLPLVEVIQDTVGRHDTFALACTAKSYEDAGYPGHANCTDNFNAALAPFNIPPRAGWPAINFFYNTQATQTGIQADESWSRPGDYVLLRAAMNLLCASSSCADDVGVTNGYNPTDILIRIYCADETFPKATARRVSAQGEARLTRQSGFHAATETLTRDFADYNGFWLPNSYTNTGPVAEYLACRQKAALIDLSALRKFEITGPDAETLLSLALTRDIRKLAVGQVVYTAMCYPHGGMIDDGTVLRLGPNNFRLVCGTEFSALWLRELASKKSLRVYVRNSTDQLHNVALQGPLSRSILAPLIYTPPLQPTIDELKWFRFTIGRLGGPQGIPLVISRTGYTGELGYELWCHPSNAVSLWNALMETGNVTPMGLAALDMLRIEAGLIFAGHEFCDQTDPYEAGIGFAVTTREEPFIGAEALARRREHPHRKLVGLDTAGAETVQHGDPVHAGRAQIGVVTSAMRSPLLAKTIALARVDAHYAALGTALEIGRLDGVQKRLPATVVKFPHYDPEKTRVRA